MARGRLAGIIVLVGALAVAGAPGRTGDGRRP